MAERKREGGTFAFALTTLTWAFGHFGHWPWWQAIPVSVPCAVIAAVIMLLARDTWPLDVPPGFADVVDGYARVGWRVTGIHPWWDCARHIRHAEHVHLAGPDHQKIIIVRRQDHLAAITL
jgi:hypothetical protein